MATTKIWDVRGRVDKLIRYVVNPDKTADLEYAAAMHSIAFPESWKRLAKKSGTVIALPAISLYLRSRLATISQLR